MKRSYNGISLRMVAASTACTGACVIIGTWFVLALMIDLCVKRIAHVVPELDPIVRSQCERDPRSLQRQFDGVLKLRFYDADTFQPAVPDNPPIDAQLLERWKAGEENPGRFIFLAAEGGIVLRRAAPKGPCSLVELHWRVARNDRLKTVFVILTLVASSMLAVMGSVVFLAVRPLRRRLAKLRHATQKLGESAGYASAADPEADDLGQLSILLDKAHARIASDATRAADRQKALEHHLANVVHDLRTPLASLQLTVEHLAAEGQNQQHGLIRCAIDDIVYMGALIENLYLACRLEEGGDPLAGDPRVDLCMLIDNITRRFATLGRIRNIEVHGAHPDGEVFVRCNAAMAGQVLANLVHNAIAHGEPGGHVATVLEVIDDTFLLKVIDDGPGVSPAEIPRIGERTFRSDEARQRDPAGGGLGLAIASEICRRAKFSLQFSAEVPRGLCATISGKLLDT